MRKKFRDLVLGEAFDPLYAYTNEHRPYAFWDRPSLLIKTSDYTGVFLPTGEAWAFNPEQIVIVCEITIKKK